MPDAKLKIAATILLAVVLVGLPVGIAMFYLNGSPSPPSSAMRDVPSSTMPTTAESSGTTAEFYRHVNQMLSVDCPASSNITYPDYPPFGAEWDRMAKAAWDAEQPALRLVREARSIKQADWPSYNFDSHRGTYLNPLRNVANHLGDAALYQHLQGDDAGAIETVKDLFVLGDLLEQNPSNRGSFLRLLVAAGIRALNSYRLLVIASDVRLSNDPNDHQKLQIATARWLIGKLLDQPDPSVMMHEVRSSGEPEILTLSRQSTARAVETFNRVNAEQTFAAMSFACHLFFMDHNRWPVSIDELIPAYLPHQSVDPWGDGHQMIGYVLVKGGLPDGSDRPMVYSRCGSKGELFYRVDQPQYGFYSNDGSNANQPHQNPRGQFRDVARWLPPAGGVAGPTTRALE